MFSHFLHSTTHVIVWHDGMWRYWRISSMKLLFSDCVMGHFNNSKQRIVLNTHYYEHCMIIQLKRYLFRQSSVNLDEQHTCIYPPRQECDYISWIINKALFVLLSRSLLRSWPLTTWFVTTSNPNRTTCEKGTFCWPIISWLSRGYCLIYLTDSCQNEWKETRLVVTPPP